MIALQDSLKFQNTRILLIFAGTYIAIDGYQKLRAIKTRNKKLDQLIMLSELEEEE